YFLFFFFFSSRRRHTRFSRDWSSDVCSSDLLNVMNLQIFNRYGKTVYSKNNYTNEWAGQTDDNKELPTGTYYYVIELTNGNVERSEERRVGKECRCGWWREQ